MAEVALIYFTMSEENVTASRAQVRQWQEELGLPQGIGSKSTATIALRKAVSEIVVDYVEGGVAWMVAAKQTAKTAEFETHTVYTRRADQAGSERRVAEVKLFAMRRTKAGLVAGSSQVKTLVTKTGSRESIAAANQWLDAFMRRFAGAHSVMPHLQIRRIAREHILTVATPMGKHKAGLYFCYMEDVPVVRTAGDFVERCAPGSTTTVLPVEPGEEAHAFLADAADRYLELELDELLSRHQAAQVGRRRTLEQVEWDQERDRLRGLVARHERRLGFLLHRSRRRLELANDAMPPMDRSGDLLSVTG